MRTRSKGFTLVELLVVISIISLLISILMPSLVKARSQAKSAVCLSNLKRIGMQGAAYVNDYAFFPPVRLKQVRSPTGTLVDYAHPIPGHTFKRQKPRWQWFLQEDLGPLIDPNQYDSEEAFNASMVIDNKYWEDPAMKTHQQDVRNGAYGYNGTYLGNTRVEDGRMVRFPVGDSQVRSPSDTVFVADSRGGNAPHGDHSYWLDPPKRAKYGDADGPEQPFSPNPGRVPDEQLGHSPVEARHVGKGNVSFCDGHAESMRLESLGYQMDSDRGTTLPVEQIDRSLANNRLWTGTGRDDPQGEHGSVAR